jgi:transcription termination/antitermination protein NusA
VRLAARLTGWDIDIITPAEYNAGIERFEKVIKLCNLTDATLLGKMVALGMVSVTDVAEVGSAPLVSELGLAEGDALLLVKSCGEEAERVQSELEQSKAHAERLAATATEGQGDGKAAGSMRVRFSARVGSEKESPAPEAASE